MTKVLGRVTGALDSPRGPDVIHRIQVAAEWLNEGATIEFELPRNLSCAACGGGGCDLCGRSGAITLRGRDEPPELLEVTLPKPSARESPLPSSPRAITLRVPERGGFARDPDLPRGFLLLSVTIGGDPAPTVSRVRSSASAELVSRPQGAVRRRTSPAVVVTAIAVILWILFLIWLRVSGRG